MSDSPKLRHNPFLNRKRKYKKKKQSITSPKKNKLLHYNANESWYKESDKNDGTPVSEVLPASSSSSRKKIEEFNSSSDEESDTSEW